MMLRKLNNLRIKDKLFEIILKLGQINLKLQNQKEMKGRILIKERKHKTTRIKFIVKI